jgi:hypothetical protein
MDDDRQREVLYELEEHERAYTRWKDARSEERMAFEERRDELLLSARELGVRSKNVAHALNRGHAEADELGDF